MSAAVSLPWASSSGLGHKAFVYYATWHWKRMLERRSQKGRVTWDRMAKIAAR